MKTKKIHTLSILVANKPGVLVRVALTFARRAYNIDSLVVSATHDPKFSRMTVTAQGDPTILEQIIKQLNKLIDVIHASEHNLSLSVDRELSLLKVKASPALKRACAGIMKANNAKVIDETDGRLIVAHIGTTDELNDFEKLMGKYGLVEMVRSGKILMTKGREKT
jgi:acetolactate synthase I/III small subunit